MLCSVRAHLLIYNQQIILKIYDVNTYMQALRSQPMIFSTEEEESS